ncbi:hypothetical protein SDRG_09252 [Saprolegnia diclina VS20]|uniref:Diphthamide biosynthesis protein 4 n=1 Tax=Saprolegnia diclina (strain VS20) TaxID=1156394 RepID=T0QHT9_SAPDV|nr:hypothetical protein SDRG_09252 [Saprolegnia diclina VS20]EQC33270.1 hypothetical protein SDRG_09252 [Saprolegnia diclina VS20]|eukprot:XP_008613393.1 hypothetical protein SDRG_09252 [Saprolegnia diclina VS20]
MASHYDLFGVAADCSQAEIKQAYHAAILMSHPDKQKAAEDVSSLDFQQVHAAYQTLRSAETRRAYDLSLQEAKLRDEKRISDEVDLDDMTFDEESGCYAHACRCGEHYFISIDELEDGTDVVPCDGCSLNIRVLYAME